MGFSIADSFVNSQDREEAVIVRSPVNRSPQQADDRGDRLEHLSALQVARLHGSPTLTRFDAEPILAK
jgi:hypothetical protein